MIGSSFGRILDRARAGDDEAYAVLWRDLNPALLRYLRVVAGGSAEDVAAETWVDVVTGLGRFRGGERDFRGWLFTIARHRALDEARRAARRPATPVPIEALHGMAADDDPAGAAMQALSTRRALALVAVLPRDQAEVVALRVIAGLDVAEVARIVGKRPGTVRVLAHRGLRGLAERLDRQAREAEV
jgi:RNA polymerase sigma-70 factor, ECF subfamily